jgi:N-acetylneuraminic acid mutarotase
MYPSGAIVHRADRRGEAMKKAALVTAILLLAVVGAKAQAQGKWVKLAPFPDPSVELYGAASGGKLYVFGGLGPGFQPKGLVYEYNPATDQWTRKKTMPFPSHHIAFAELNGKIYGFGGFVLPSTGPAGWVPIDNAWEYSPSNDTWKALAPMPTKRGSPVAAAVGGKIYVIGGAGFHPGSSEIALFSNRPHRSLPTVEEYDPSANAWRARSPMPTARNHAAVGVVGGKIYVIGGRMGAAFMGVASNTDVVEEYDPATDSWGAVRARMPTPRSASAWGTHQGWIYVAGGEFQNAQMMAAYRALEAYNPATNQWITLPSMLSPRHGLAGAVIGNRFHVVAGNIQSDGIVGAHIESDSHEAFEILDH